jgi:RNA polymerase sigma-70 factor (sigma-E family)
MGVVPHGSLGGEMPQVSTGQSEVEYAEFVDGEWAALYRTAYLLTGDHRPAEKIAQTALVTVCLAWPRVAAMQHPEASTRRLMVKQLTSWWRLRTSREPPGLTLVEPAQPASYDSAVQPSTIWSLVLDLPPRQRAVVVLRYYEDRSDAAIAEVLGTSSGSVTAQAHEALAALRSRLGTSVEELVSQSAHRVAAEVLPPSAPSAAELRARARARRRRRAGAAAVATAAAVIAAVTLVPTLRGQPDDEKVDDIRPLLGSVPAWMDSVGDIHVGDDVIDLPAFPLNPSWGVSYPEPSFALTATGVVWPARAWNGPLYWQPLDGQPIPLNDETPISFTADPRGDHVVWITKGHDIVTYDVGQRRTVDTSPVRGTMADDSPRPILFVSEDRVVYEAGGAVWILDLTTKRTTRMPDVTSSGLLDYGNGVSVVATSHPPNRRAAGARSLTDIEFRTDAGPVQAESGPLLRGGRLSPDGRWFVTSTGYQPGPRPVVLDTRTGEQVPIDLPERMIGAYAAPWGWAGADVLLISLKLPDSGYGLLWTCQPAIGACERLLSDAPLDAHPG